MGDINIQKGKYPHYLCVLALSSQAALLTHTYAKDALCAVLTDSPSSLITGLSAAWNERGRFTNSFLEK